MTCLNNVTPLPLSGRSRHITLGGVGVETESRAAALAHVRALTSSGAARSIRLAARLSLGDIVTELPGHVSRSTVLRWERGERLPRGEAALSYGALLDRLMRER